MCSGTSKVGTWRTGLSKRPTSSELDGSSSDTETEQTDHCARGSEVAKGGGAKAARSHTRQVRFATPDASVELYALTLVGGHLREAVPVISRVARELHQLLDPCECGVWPPACSRCSHHGLWVARGSPW